MQVYRDEKNIKGSPFNVSVSDKDIANAGKVKVTGATEKAVANESNVLNIDASEAGRSHFFAA